MAALPQPPRGARIGFRPPQRCGQREERQRQRQIPDTHVRRPSGDGEQQPQREPDAGEEKDDYLERNVRKEDPGSEPGATATAFRQGHEGDRDGRQEAPGREQDDAVDLW